MTHETAATACACPYCAKEIVKPRRNQTYCSAECRAAAKVQKRGRNTEPKMDSCPQCGERFVKTRKTKRFCSTACQQDFNNFWKAKGPALALALHDWRVAKVPRGLSRVCQEFSRAREDLKDRRSRTAKAKSSTSKGK